MSQDFVTTLRLQLREAAEREARRGPLRRAAPSARPLALAGALALAIAAIVLAGSRIGGHQAAKPATDHAPRVVTRLALATRGGRLAVGFGSLWVADPGSGRVLRVAADGGVVAAIPIRGDLFDVDVAAGAVWALTDARLFRIDARTNRVTAATSLPLPTRSSAAVLSGAGSVWVLNPSALLRVEPRTGRISGSVTLERGGLAPRGLAVAPGVFYVRRADGRVETLDARTGTRLGLARPQLDGDPVAAGDGAVVISSGQGIAALDPSTGRLRWRTNLGISRLNGAFLGDGALWVQGTPVSGRDQLWRLDQRTGAVTAALALPDFGVTGMATIGGRLWIMSPSGTVSVIR